MNNPSCRNEEAGAHFRTRLRIGHAIPRALRRRLRVTGVLAALAAAFACADSGPDLLEPTGSLEPTDSTFSGGKYFDRYEVNVAAGQTLTVDLTSEAFDPYIVVRSPTGQEWTNDDHDGSRSASHIEVEASETGSWSVLATSFETAAVGSYGLSYDITGERSETVDGARIESGALGFDDPQIESGEFRDLYTVPGEAGQILRLDMRSADFDTYLFVRSPSNEGVDNDDFNGDRSRSVVTWTLPEDGEYRVFATSSLVGETGEYSLSIRVDEGGIPESRIETGLLEIADDTLVSGEFADEITFEGRPGDRVEVRMISEEIDPYLIVLGPNQDRGENDDDGESHNARVVMDLTESGTYRVLATSYRPGETGAYEVAIGQPLDSPENAENRDVTELTFDLPVTASLETTDGQLDRGRFRDLYAFESAPGDFVSVRMESSEVDPYLTLIDPDGNEISNDDWEGSRTLSRIDQLIARPGRYRVVATSYASAEVGSYEISVEQSPMTLPVTLSDDPGRVFGVFVGISDYPGEVNDLAYTATDAQRLADALLAGGGMAGEDFVVLTDTDATRENVFEAVRTMGGRAGPEDTFVFFYSGHGDRITRVSADAADPDGLDETIELYDASVRDDEFGDLLDEIRPGRLLLLLDACFSGGFSKDIISVPGRMGLFSSEEDVTSSVAAKFRAGGFLALFAADAIGERLADFNGDDQLTALELSQYIHERYRADVKSGGPDDYVRTSGPQMGYQHLVVDRGGIPASTILFR